CRQQDPTAAQITFRVTTPCLQPVAVMGDGNSERRELPDLGSPASIPPHIATNVVTAGITHRAITWDVSGFRGREPNEKRWGIEGGAIDSLATRLTVAPTARWSGQFSVGHINNREATHPLRDSLRTTGSLTYVRPLAAGRWASSFVGGRNHDVACTQLPNANSFPVASRSIGLLGARIHAHPWADLKFVHPGIHTAV
ncbi:MAG: hypothetical protein ABIZ80_16985, partial [Bryobacteraceae bacterium]